MIKDIPTRPTLALSTCGQLECVVLLHGLFATSRSMRIIEGRLTGLGYQVHNWSYPTFWRSTATHVRRLLPLLNTLESDSQVGSLHFVTHSMGGILARGALHVANFRKAKRLVMLAPPNKGSHLTRISMGPFAWCVPAIAELSEGPGSLPNRLTIAPEIEIGVIAAQQDFVVQMANTRLVNQRDHYTVDTTHFGLPRHEIAVQQVVHFLACGRFETTGSVTHAAA